MKQDERTPVYTEGVCGDGAMILRDGQPFPISSAIDALNAYTSTEALRSALADELVWHEAAEKALSKQPPSGDRGWRRAEHQERIDAIRAALSGGATISKNEIVRSASPAPSTEGLRELASEARFLLNRLSELSFDDLDDHTRDFNGHVEPSISRLGKLLDAIEARTALAGPDTFDLEAFLADELEPGELRPCPFCGGKAEVHEFDDVGEDDENFGGSAIMCTQCQCSTAVHFDRKEHLHSSWNERCKSSAPSAGVTAPQEVE